MKTLSLSQVQELQKEYLHETHSVSSRQLSQSYVEPPSKPVTGPSSGRRASKQRITKTPITKPIPDKRGSTSALGVQKPTRDTAYKAYFQVTKK